jgi:hypothetical protein
MTAAASVFPKLFGKSTNACVPGAVAAVGQGTFTVRSDARTVARRDAVV